MGKRPGVFRGDKKRKEISRQKKQEEKRLRRFNKGKEPAPGETADIASTDMDVRNAEIENQGPPEQKQESGGEITS
jgi:hypothetical protein